MHDHNIEEDAFGFGAIRTTAKARIKQIRPAAPPEPPSDLTEVDDIAGNAGFVSREVPTQETPGMTTRRGRPRAPEAFEAINMRAPSSLAKAYRRWCDENRYSYPAALAEIMRRAGIPTS